MGDTTRSQQCCSGFRQWNAMECFDRFDASGPLPYFCDVTGHNQHQLYTWRDDGRIQYSEGQCLGEGTDGRSTAPVDCNGAPAWESIESFLPDETKTYKAEVERLGLSDSMPDN